MIKVVDAIMGSGKSTAAINYMNSHPDKKFIYVTPYLSETERIVKECRELNFKTPVHDKKYSYSKICHTEELLKNGYNIATTHQSFKSYHKDILKFIKEKEYTIIIDENIDALIPVEITWSDIELFVYRGIAKINKDGQLSAGEVEYNNGKLLDFYRILKSKDIVYNANKSKGDLCFYWELPPELITAAEDTYILTYLFEGQSLCYLLNMYNIPYTKIGISTKSGEYEFSETEFSIPEYTKKLSEKIHILDDEKLNSVGDNKTALSENWLRTHKEERKAIQNNMYNFFRHKTGSESQERMWSTYVNFRHDLQGKGYARCFVPFNARATNEYRNKTTLAYCVNIYMNVGQKLFYESKGVKVDEDMYALSTMVQWVWRSAIRDEKDADLYLPSKRMRKLLQGWMESLNKGESDNE